MATGLENLWIYKLAEDLEIKVHEVTAKFPKDEIFRSVDQLRRSSASVANNIAESYHKSSAKDKNRILELAKGEAEESKRNILKSARKKFLGVDEANVIAEQYITLFKGMSKYQQFILLNDQSKNNNDDRKKKNDDRKKNDKSDEGNSQ